MKINEEPASEFVCTCNTDEDGKFPNLLPHFVYDEERVESINYYFCPCCGQISVEP